MSDPPTFLLPLAERVRKLSKSQRVVRIFRERLNRWHDNLKSRSEQRAGWFKKREQHKRKALADCQSQDSSKSPGDGWTFEQFHTVARHYRRVKPKGSKRTIEVAHSSPQIQEAWFPPGLRQGDEPIALCPLPLPKHDMLARGRELSDDENFVIAAAIHDCVYSSLPGKLSPWKPAPHFWVEMLAEAKKLTPTDAAEIAAIVADVEAMPRRKPDARKTKRGPGRPRKHEPSAAQKLVSDCKESGMTEKDFESKRGLAYGSVTKAKDRLRSLARRNPVKSGAN